MPFLMTTHKWGSHELPGVQCSLALGRDRTHALWTRSHRLNPLGYLTALILLHCSIQIMKEHIHKKIKVVLCLFIFKSFSKVFFRCDLKALLFSSQDKALFSQKYFHLEKMKKGPVSDKNMNCYKSLLIFPAHEFFILII